MSTCFFIGHRDAPLSLQQKLDDVVLDLTENCGVAEFIVGYHGNFDQMATNAIRKAKRLHPEICALRLIPYHPSERDIPIPASFDGTYYPIELTRTPRRFAIKEANMVVLNHCDYLITYVCRNGGNAACLLRKAEKKGTLKIINLSERDVF